MNISGIFSVYQKQIISTLLILLLPLLVTSCSTSSDNEVTDITSSNVSLRVEVPTQFDDTFCAAINISGEDFGTMSTQTTYPAGTEFIDTVIPNIPEGRNRVVELGIFANGKCAEPAEGDWYGIQKGVLLLSNEVTLVAIQLVQQSPTPGTGTVIIRNGGTFFRTILHGEVVNAGTGDPIAGANCDISEGGVSIGNVASGAATLDLGVLNTTVEVQLGSSELSLNCTHKGFSPTMQTAQLILNPADTRNGTFIVTVPMKSGVSVEILRSDTESLSALIHIPELQLRKVDSFYGEFDQVDNTDKSFSVKGGGVDNLSLPEIPVHTMLIAVPVDQDQPEISVSAASNGMQMAARLYPVQPPHRDAAGVNKGDPNQVDDEPFVFNQKLYLTGSSSIQQFESNNDSRNVEGVNLFELKVNLVDYDPRSLLLTTYSTLQLDVEFSAGGCFKYERKADGFNMDNIDQSIESVPTILSNSILNQNVLTKVCDLQIRPIFFGARYIIISPPEMLSAANDLKIHKISRGISTVVVSTDDISTSSVTAADIKAYLTNAYSNWWIRPKWVLLMGDAEFIPTHYGAQNSWDSALNAGDIYFGQITGNSLSLPVFGIGRFPVDNNTQAQSIVDKVKAFENSPPGGIIFDNPYYSDTTFAAEFQDNGQGTGNVALDGIAERWFAETSERIRSKLVPSGISVERIYEVDPISSNPTTYHDGNPVPFNLRKPTFAWDGDTTDIINATNDGTSILYHRDHGWWSGWGTPSFRTSDLSSVSVSNNEFPVVYSINCASGIFDNETVDDPANKVGFGYGPSYSGVYWGEAFVRQADGAIAVIGDTRSSSTVLNNDFAEGLFDATWPGHLAYGSNTVIRKLGDILNHAKGYVKSKGYGNASTLQEIKIYNLLGDPTLDVRTRPPKSIAFTTILREQTRLLFGIECLTCPPNIDPINIVIQDLKGNIISRDNASLNGSTFNVDLDLGNFRGDMKITASGYDVLTEEIIFTDKVL